MPRAMIRSSFEGPAGRLEGLLHVPEEPRFLAVACHPHPLHGGSMDSKPTYRIARGLEDAGGLVLRFNFRGVGASQGEHDGGRGEQDDLRAALAHAREHAKEQAPTPLPAVLAGFSFGSAVVAQAGSGDASLAGLLLVGAPLRFHAFDELAASAARIAFVHGERDEHGPLDALLALVARLGARATLRVVEGAGHLFEGHGPELQAIVSDLARSGALGALGSATP